MSEQSIYSVSAACFGFISALFFGVGSALTSKGRMVALCKTYWTFNREYAASTVSQSTQYAVGALLLVVSFLLQMLAVPASQANQEWSCPIFGNLLLFVLLLLVLIGLPSFLLSRWLTKWRLLQVIQELEKSK